MGTLKAKKEYDRAERLERVVGDVSFLGRAPLSLIVGSGGVDFTKRAAAVAGNLSSDTAVGTKRMRFAWLVGGSYVVADPKELAFIDRLVAQLDETDVQLLRQVHALASNIRYRVETNGVEMGVAVVEEHRQATTSSWLTGSVALHKETR